MNHPERPDSAPPPTSEGAASSIFFGPDGLRAGWGLLLFLILYFALQAGLAGVFHLAGIHLHPPGADAILEPRFALWSESLLATAIILATVLMSFIERRPLSDYGVAKARRGRSLLAGAACGLAFIAILVLLLRACGLLVFDSLALHGTAILRYGAVWLAEFALVGLYEELFFRGYLQATLSRGLTGIFAAFNASHPRAAGFWASAVLLSFGFGLVHTTNPGESPVGVFAAGAIGLVFCLSLWRTGALWWAIGFHAAWDWGESYLFGVYDSGLLARGRLLETHPQGKLLLSGGLTGPEGSLLIVPVLAGTIAVILITLKPQTPPSSELPAAATEDNRSFISQRLD